MKMLAKLFVSMIWIVGTLWGILVVLVVLSFLFGAKAQAGTTCIKKTVTGYVAVPCVTQPVQAPVKQTPGVEQCLTADHSGNQKVIACNRKRDLESSLNGLLSAKGQSGAR